MTNIIKILHLEDVQSDAELVERTLKKSEINFEKKLVDNREDFTKALTNFRPDIILSDHSLPAFNSLEALDVLKQSGLHIPFILITATVSEEFAVNVMREGATDYVLKDRLQRLPNAIINALEKFRSDTDRQTYLDKIIASESLFTKAESIAEFGTWTVDLANNINNWSPGSYILLGYEPGTVEPTYENFLRHIHPEDIPLVEEDFKDASKQFRPGGIDFRVIDKDGHTRYVHSQFEFEFDEKGRPAHIIGFNQDVTNAKLAQAEIQSHVDELQAASERQTAIINALPPNIVLLNEAGKIVAVNESWKKFTLANNLGVPRYGIGFSYTAISEKATGVDPSSGKKIAKGIKDVIEGTKDEFLMEYSCYTQKKKVWFQIVVAPLKDKTRKGAVILHIDITPRKTAEELLLKSRANLQTIFENTDIAYVLCDAEHKIISFNSRAAKLATEQFNKKLKIGGNAFSYFPKNKIPDVKDAIQKVTRNEMICYETSYDLNDGSVRWYEVRWVGVGDERNENIGFILAFKDITERKIAELERDRITNDLVQRNKDLEQFTYIVSHNLRAPVANILGLSDMLNSSDFDTQESEEIKTSLSISVNQLDNMIIDLNQILQVSSRVNERTEVVAFDSLVEDIILSLRNLIKNENAVIHYNFNAGNKIMAIKSYVHSIFYNLISNAIKYRQPNVEPVINVFSRKNEDKLEIVFKDNGKGIDEKNMKSLFGLYKRFDTSVEGKGMGLFMVKMQTETLGGKITVESEPGVGTTFIVELPDIKLVSE